MLVEGRGYFDMTELEEIRARFVKEILRISGKLGESNITQADYMAEYGPDLSLAALSGRAKWRFNQLKIAAGLKVSDAGGHVKAKVVKPITSKVKQPTRECNKCEGQFIRTPKNRIICKTCAEANAKTTEEVEERRIFLR